MEEFYSKIENEQKNMFKEIEEYLFELGYKPSRAKTKDLNIVFKNSKTKEHIVKFSIEKEKPVLKLKFYSSSIYSNVFSEAIKNTIEEYQYKYTGCYKCGKCKESLEGYIYEYPDGRKYFRCAKELISLPTVRMENLDEIKQMIRVHHSYLMNKI